MMIYPIDFTYSGFYKVIASIVDDGKDNSYKECLIECIYFYFFPRRTYKYQIQSIVYRVKFEPSINANELDTRIRNFPALYLSFYDSELALKKDAKKVGERSLGAFKEFDELKSCFIKQYEEAECYEAHMNYLSPPD